MSARTIWTVLWRYVRRVVRAARLLAGAPDLPRPLRWLLFLAVIPIPGPVDEAIALVALSIVAIFYRQVLTRCWQEAQK